MVPPIAGQILRSEDCVVLLCDVQERLGQAMGDAFPTLVKVGARLVSAAQLLDIPIVYTEQYPKGLGATAGELGLAAGGRNFRFEKTLFSMLTEEVAAKLRELGKRTVLLWGMETHVCVQQTALDAMAQGYAVHVIADGCLSRTALDKELALSRLRSAGAIVTSHEALLFQLIGRKEHPHFKAISGLVRELLHPPIAAATPKL